MEVILIQNISKRKSVSILHVCGGDPQFDHNVYKWKEVFSTYVEVILSAKCAFLFWWSILHVCGGDPVRLWEFFLLMYSPRMWRWSLYHNLFLIFGIVFSTYVEVIPKNVILSKSINCILHVCGGDPKLTHLTSEKLQYSPRMWRWSYFDGEELGDIYVFSTYVEVILKAMQQSQQMQSILHVCGGDPNWRVEHRRWCRYSPRMWRWSLRGIDQKETITVFSTHVESVTVLERTDK